MSKWYTCILIAELLVQNIGVNWGLFAVPRFPQYSAYIKNIVEAVMDELDGSIAIPTIVSGDMEGIQPSVSGLSNLSIWDMISDYSWG